MASIQRIGVIITIITGIALMSSTLASAQDQLKETGASAAFTSADPVVQQALAMIKEGKFKEASSLLASDDGHASENVAGAREEMKEIIRRTKRDYAVSPQQMVEKLKKDIPDVTEQDIERWRKAGEIQFRVVDGEVKYFRREPSNLFRFCEEAKKRRVGGQKTQAGMPVPPWTLVKHLENVVAAAEKSEQVELLPIKHRLTYAVTIDGDRHGAKKGSVVRVWLPFLQEYRQQKDVKLVSTTKPDGASGPTVAPTTAPQRTIYFEYAIEDPGKAITFGHVMEYTSYAYYPRIRDEDAKTQANVDASYLAERAPHIVFTPEIRKKVAEIVGDETNPLIKVRKMFYWIDANIKYHAEQEYSTMDSFALQCLSRGKGDCGVQSILFVTMCRAAGVPARWQSGWETKRDRNSMHDWAEVYIEPWGWLPCDQSYGLQKSSDPRVRDFYIGHQDSYRTIINLDYGRELVPPKKSLRSEPADFQVGEIEIDGRNLFYDEWDWDMKIEWLTDEKF